jgi:transitional endoplasmic reticulum ATPase
MRAQPEVARPSWVWWLGASLLVVTYLIVVPTAWASRGWRAGGPLDRHAPEIADEARVTPEAATGAEIKAQCADRYGHGEDGSTIVLVGGMVDGAPYYACYDIDSDDTVYDARVVDARTGAEVPDAVDVAKRGGAWVYVGAVKTPGELVGGACALIAALATGVTYHRRRRQRAKDTKKRKRRTASTFFWLSVALTTLFLVAVWGVAVTYPDRVSFVVLTLVSGGVLWGPVAGYVLIRPGAPLRPRGIRLRRRDVEIPRMNPFRRDRAKSPGAIPPAEAPAPTPPATRFTVVKPAALPDFDDVGGMSAVKEELAESLGALLAFPDEASAYGIEFNGVLLHGPPGVGKTFLAKAVAGEYALSFLHVTAADLVSKFVGETARNVDAVFRSAAANVPCLLFFDEFDAIANDRDDQPNPEDRRTVAQLLVSLERYRGLRELVVMAATNDLDGLDDGIVRPGRFDRHVRVDLPDAEARQQILAASLRGRPLADEVDLGTLVRRTEGQTSATICAVVEGAALAAFHLATERGTRVKISNSHLLDALAARGGKDRPTVESWSWDRLILPPDTKAELQLLQRVVENPERARKYGVRPPSGLLLTGPPGTGKTTIARVLAAQARCSFYPVTVADLTSKWVGDAEDSVAKLFARARANAPSIIFFDEIDAIAARRGRGQSFDDRLLNQLLAEIDGLESRGDVFVIGATNRPDVVDPAVTRGGRLSRVLEIGLPRQAERRALLALHSAPMPLRDVDLEALATAADGMSGADLEALCQQAALLAMIDDEGTKVPASVTQDDFERAIIDLREGRAGSGG